MKNIKSWIALMAFSLIVLGVPAIASAQWRNDDDDDYYGRSNSRYGNDIRSTIQDLKYKARNFEDAADRSRGGYRNNGRYGGGYNNGNIEDLADRFSQAVNRLENAYGRGRNLRNSEDEARRVLDIAQQIDNQLYNARGGNNYLFNEWNSMSQDLRIIAREYGFRYNGGYRNNRNYPNRNGGGWGNGQKPSWWPF